MDLAAFDALMRAVLPAKGGLASFEYVEAEQRSDSFFVVARTVMWRRKDDGTHEITDVKEQQLHFAPVATDSARLEAYVRAWCAALSRVFEEGTKVNTERFDWVMPHDLIFPKALALKTAHDVAGFEKALLQKSRLGKFLDKPPP